MVEEERNCRACKYYTECDKIWGTIQHSYCPKVDWTRIDDEAIRRVQEDKRSLAEEYRKKREEDRKNPGKGKGSWPKKSYLGW